MDEKKQVQTKRAVVVGKSGDKSIKVQIAYRVKHPVYGKYIRRQTRLGVHDENNQAGIGDVVEIAACRPISKTKSWRLTKVLQKGIIE